MKERSINNSWRGSIISGYLLSYLVPILLLSIVYIILNITPFGNESLLTIDLKGQYISFFSYLKDALIGGDNVFYSFSKTMSGSMIGLVGYYLISPFNILFLFAETADYPAVITTITLLKTGAAGLTMYLYLKRYNPNFHTLLFSTTYALSGYAIIYQQNIMWIDSVILLPLVIKGIDNLFEGKNMYVYPVFLALAVLTNYYIGFMICIFSVVYFIGNSIHYVITNKKIKKDYVHILIKFVVFSGIAGGISSLTWLPAIMSYSGSSKVAFEWMELMDASSNFTVIEFMSKFIVGAMSREQIIGGLPNVYTSISIVLLATLFFINSKIKLSDKIKYGFIILTMYFSFMLVGGNMIWHGFSEPTWFPYRNSFLFIFVVVTIAAKQFKTDNYGIGKIGSVFIGFTTIVYLIYRSNFEFLETQNIVISFCIGLLTIIALMLFESKKWQKSILVGVLFAIISLDTVFNGYLTLSENNYDSATEFTEFVEKKKPIMNKYSPKDNEIYRLEKTAYYDANDPLLLNYPGLSHYSSNELDGVKEFLGNLGYRNNGSWVRYGRGSNWFSDSFMGIKYRVSDNTRNYLESVETIEDLTVQENSTAFPLGFLANNIINVSGTYSNTFEYQNDLIHTLFDIENFHQKVSPENIEFSVTNLEIIEEENRTIFTKIDSGEEAYINFEINNLEEGSHLSTYFRSSTLNNNAIELFFDDQSSGITLNTYGNTAHSANVNGNSINVRLELLNDEIQYREPLFYSSNVEEFKELYNRVEENKFNISQFEPNHIVGNIVNATEDYLIFTMPYDEGWEITINDERVKPELVLETMVGVKLQPGNNNVELKFVPKGLKLSLIIAALSLLILLGTYTFRKRTGNIE